MNISKATKEQIKNILEWDHMVPTPLLCEVYEESVKKEVHKRFVVSCILNLFGSPERAERLTKMNLNELKWFCYERGFEAVKKFTPGNRPFIALWSIYIRRHLKDLARDLSAQKRSAEIISLEQAGDWSLPPTAHNTEKTALNRVYIESLLNHLTDTEKEIAFKRYEGYTLNEIADMQGITKSGIQRRIQLYVKRIKGETNELAEIV